MDIGLSYLFNLLILDVLKNMPTGELFYLFLNKFCDDELLILDLPVLISLLFNFLFCSIKLQYFRSLRSLNYSI